MRGSSATRMIFRALLLSALAIPGGAAVAATVEYIHTDALGSPVAVTDSSGEIIERREYEPYGRQLSPPVADGPGYTGHVSDAATGLDYMQQRYYDPVIGRFLSVDPISVSSNGGNFNRYKYAANNPYRFTDPDGRCEKKTGSNLCPHETKAERKARSEAAILALATGGTLAGGAGGQTVGQVVGQGLKAVARAAGTALGAGASAAAVGFGAMVYSPDLGSKNELLERDLSIPANSWKIGEGQTLYRVWGGASTVQGASWTPINPVSLRMAGYNFRDIAGLPNVNTGAMLTVGILRNPNGVVAIRPAMPFDGNVGGLVEFVVPNPALSIDYVNTFNIDPHF